MHLNRHKCLNRHIVSDRSYVVGYTHYFTFLKTKGQAVQNERNYQKAILDCQRVITRYSKAHDGLSGYSAHTKLGAYGGIKVNGSGSDGHEAFILREHFSENERGFCKTARKPYDVVVVACLAILQHRLKDAVKISSDGRPVDWMEGLKLARKVTGLSIGMPPGVN